MISSLKFIQSLTSKSSLVARSYDSVQSSRLDGVLVDYLQIGVVKGGGSFESFLNQVDHKNIEFGAGLGFFIEECRVVSN